MIKSLALAVVGATVLMAGPAFAGVNSDSPPMPYTAPDPVYTAHKIDSTVDMTQPKNEVELSGNQPAPGTVAPKTR